MVPTNHNQTQTKTMTDQATDSPHFTVFKSAIETAIYCMELNTRRPELEHPRFKAVENPQALAAYLRDYRTVSIDCGQRIGKTHWINEVATPEDMIVQATPYSWTTKAVITQFVGDTLFGPPLGFSPKTVYVDRASLLLTPRKRELLYEVLANNIEQRFVLLG